MTMARKSRRAKKARNSIRFARVPTGNETCGWCFMLSSRGFVYNSESSAMASSHKGCDCVIVPGVEHDAIDWYDPKGMAERWRDCVDTVNNASLERRARAEWDAMSDAEKKRYHADISNETAAFIETLQQTEREKMERLGIGYEQLDRSAFKRFYQERLRIEACAEAETRSGSWLYKGIVDEPGFVDDAHRARIENESPHEIKTARRLAEHGISPKFRIDEYHYYDENGEKKTIGLADLECNVELKTLSGASSRNTINGYLKNASSKEQCDAVVFDNFDNKELSDSDLIDVIRQCRSFRRGRVYILSHESKLIKIR